MAAEPFTIWTDELVVVSQASPTPNGNGKWVLKTSAKQNNTQNKNAIKLDIRFKDVELVGGGAPSLGGWGLRAVVESSDGTNPGNWSRVAAMFEPLRDPAQGERQLIVAQPDIINLNEGVPYDEWDGNAVAYRIHRQQGSLGQDFRIVIELAETKFGTPEALKQFKVTAFGERYGD